MSTDDALIAAYSGAVPAHVAIIMDGNGRWATRQGLERTGGHEAGARSVRTITRACAKLGVEVLTLYSFSTENWQRPQLEVSALMALLADYLRTEADELMDNQIRLRAIGEISRLPRTVRFLLNRVRKLTRNNDRMDLVLALSYGSRQEIVQAVRELAERVEAGEILSADIDAAAISSHLYTSFAPDPDVIIRTSGEQRLSNFLLWQSAYSEMYVTDVLWPDFSTAQLLAAFESFGERKRRYGRTDEQMVDASE